MGVCLDARDLPPDFFVCTRAVALLTYKGKEQVDKYGLIFD